MFHITKKESIDLIISFLVISLGFSILYSNRNPGTLIFILPMIMIGVGLGFILHELAHKYAALHYGYWAEFKLWIPGLVFSLITSFFGFIFAAPGAVYIYGDYMSNRENGIISIVGPLTNIILALIFLGILLNAGAIFGLYTVETSIIQSICFLGFSTNSFLALFNLIPISMLDGRKVFNWNPLIWLIITAFAGILVYYTYNGGLINLLM
ncbi:MAG: site-2 protease family protein [Methanobrevibacter sp.]